MPVDIWLSIFGILANGLSVLIIHRDKDHNMNIKSAYIHLLSDTGASIAVLAGGILIEFFEIYSVDGILTLLIAAYLIGIGYRLLRNSTNVLMLFSPRSLDIQEIITDLKKLPHVKTLYHIHIWQVNEFEIHLEAHIDFGIDLQLSEFEKILDQIRVMLVRSYGINHVNIQPQYQTKDNKELIVID